MGKAAVIVMRGTTIEGGVSWRVDQSAEGPLVNRWVMWSIMRGTEGRLIDGGQNCEEESGE